MGEEPGEKPEGTVASPVGERDPRLGPKDEERTERPTSQPDIVTPLSKTAGSPDSTPGFGRDSPAGYAGAMT